MLPFLFHLLHGPCPGLGSLLLWEQGSLSVFSRTQGQPRRAPWHAQSIVHRVLLTWEQLSPSSLQRHH